MKYLFLLLLSACGGSAIGEPGKDGVQGAQGAQGAQGVPGKDATLHTYSLSSSGEFLPATIYVYCTSEKDIVLNGGCAIDETDAGARLTIDAPATENKRHGWQCAAETNDLGTGRLTATLTCFSTM